MKRTSNRIASLLIIAFVMGSCVETIVMDPREKDMPIVVNCLLTNSMLRDTMRTMTNPADTPIPYLGWKQSMTIRYAKGKADSDFIPVSDAKVYITYPVSSSSHYHLSDTLSFIHVGNGLWESDRPLYIERGLEYSLFIEIPGQETIRAKTTGISGGIPLKETFVRRSAKASGYHYEYSPTDTSLIVDFDPAVEKELEEHITRNPYYFLWDSESIKNGTFIDYDMYDKVKGNALWVFAEEWTSDGWKDLDYLVTNYPYADDFNVTARLFSELSVFGSQDPDDEWDIRLKEIFESGKNYYGGLRLHEGFLRIGKIEPELYFFMSAGPLWYLNLKANDYYGKYEVNGDNELPIGWAHREFILYKLHIVNADLDNYLRSIYVHNTQLNHSLTELYSTVPGIYSNIEGGLGIFACEEYRLLPFHEPRGYYLIDPVFDDDDNPFRD